MSEINFAIIAVAGLFIAIGISILAYEKYTKSHRPH